LSIAPPRIVIAPLSRIPESIPNLESKYSNHASPLAESFHDEGRDVLLFPLVCPLGGAEMSIIAFITDGPTVRDILVHLGEPAAPPRIAPARGRPRRSCRSRAPPGRSGRRWR